MYRKWLLLSLLSTACARPENLTSPDIQSTPDRAAPAAIPSTMARLLAYDNMPIRARVFSKKNGPKLLRATQALQLNLVGSHLTTSVRSDRTGPIRIGKGLELVGFGANQEALPPCTEGSYDIQYWGTLCQPPLCSEVDNVEPCTHDEEGGGEGGSGGGGEGGGSSSTLYQRMLTDTSFTNRIAEQYTSAAGFTPVARDSLHPDSLAIAIGDTMGVVFTTVLDSDGLILATTADLDSMATGQAYTYDNGVLSSITIMTFTPQGDTLSIEVTPELTEAQLRHDWYALNAARTTAIFDDDTTCGRQKIEALSSGIQLGSGVWEFVKDHADDIPVIEAVKAVKELGDVTEAGGRIAAQPGLVGKAVQAGKEAVGGARKVINEKLGSVVGIPEQLALLGGAAGAAASKVFELVQCIFTP